MNALDDLKIIFKGHRQLEELCLQKKFIEAGNYLLLPEHHLIRGIIVQKSDTSQPGVAIHAFMELGLAFSTLLWDIYHQVAAEYDCRVFSNPTFVKSSSNVDYIVQNDYATEEQHTARYEDFNYSCFLQVRLQSGMGIDDLTIKDEARFNWFTYTCMDQSSLIAMFERGYFDSLTEKELKRAGRVAFGRGYLTLHKVLVEHQPDQTNF